MSIAATNMFLFVVGRVVLMSRKVLKPNVTTFERDALTEDRVGYACSVMFVGSRIAHIGSLKKIKML